MICCQCTAVERQRQILCKLCSKTSGGAPSWRQLSALSMRNWADPGRATALQSFAADTTLGLNETLGYQELAIYAGLDVSSYLRVAGP